MGVDMNASLDLYELFVNQIAGGEAIFIFLSFAILAIASARLRLPNMVTIVIFAVYGVFISAFFQSVLAITITLVGMFFAFMLGRLIKT